MTKSLDKTLEPKQETKDVREFPFGSNIPRFLRSYCHAKLDTSGLYVKKPRACDPVLYHPQQVDEVYRRIHASYAKEPWRCKVELEDWSKNLGYRNQKNQAERKYVKTILGPAWHEVTELPKYEPACKNVNFGRVPRFRSKDPGYPGPADYTRTVPYRVPYGPHSTRPTFEREEACRMKDVSIKWSLAPNRYIIIDRESIEQKPNKLVSLKGPYALFTGPRDGTTIKNHFNTTGRISVKSWPPEAPPSDLTRLEKTHLGEWNKTGRDLPYRGRNGVFDLANAPRKPSEPGPAHYTLEPEHEAVQYIHGFNSSYDKEPGHVPFRIWPAVGRYKLEKKPVPISGHGHRHVFLSKVQRTMGCYLPEKMNSF